MKLYLIVNYLICLNFFFRRHDQGPGRSQVRRDPGRAHPGPQRHRADRRGGPGHQAGMHRQGIRGDHPLPSHRCRVGA